VSQTIDLNVLLYASNEDAPEHARANALVRHLASGPEIIVLFWPVLMGYLRIATHRSVFTRPLSAAEAQANIDALVARPHLRVAGERERFWATYGDVTREVPAQGNGVPDAHLVALMVEHGVATIWSRDRDFRKYPHIVVRDPFDERYSTAFGDGGRAP
jgi:toxin-antitoxin system PIN domain toxin